MSLISLPTACVHRPWRLQSHLARTGHIQQPKNAGHKLTILNKKRTENSAWMRLCIHWTHFFRRNEYLWMMPPPPGHIVSLWGCSHDSGTCLSQILTTRNTFLNACSHLCFGFSKKESKNVMTRTAGPTIRGFD